MVEENFKLNINLQLDQGGLSDLQRQIEKAVKDAFTKATRNVKVSAPGTSGAGPTSATARSAREAISVSGRDLGRSIQQAIRDDIRGFEAAAARMEKAVDRLTKAMERGRSAAPSPARRDREEVVAGVLRSRAGRVANLRQQQDSARRTGGPRGERESERLEVEILREKKKALRTAKLQQRIREKARQNSQKVEQSEEALAKANQALAKAREREAAASARNLRTSPPPGTSQGPRQTGPRERVAAKQVGPSNQQTGANIDATRKAGSQRTAGGTGASNIVADAPRVSDRRVGTVQDRPNFGKEAQKRVKARESAGAEYSKAAQATSERVAASIGKLEAAIRQLPQFRTADLAQAIGLPGRESLGVGRGAAPTVKLPSGQERVIKQALSIITDELGSVQIKTGDVITSRIEKLLSSGSLSPGGRIEKVGRFRPDRAQAILREEIRQMLEGPKLDTSKVMGGFAAAGQAQMSFRPTEEQRRRIASKPPGAAQIAETVAILHDMTKGSEAFKRAGLELVSVIGMAEDKAAALSDAIEAFAKGKTESIEGLVQTRNLAGMGVGGPGSMRQARSFLMTQTQEMVGGQVPKIKGIGEEAAFAGDLFGKKAAVHLKTAIVSADLIPELKEDQFLLAKEAAKSMGLIQKKSTLVKDVGEDIVPGMMLQQGQVLGKNVKGQAVQFDLKGAEAQVTAVTKIIENGIEAWKVEYEELNQMVTGGKMTTRAGGKGIVRVEEGEDLQKFGLPKGTQVAMAAEGMAKRGDLRTLIEMHAGNIGKEIGQGGQEVADMIVDRMKDLGEALNVAVKTVAQQLGVKGYTGAEMVTQGPLAKAKGGQAAITTGEVAWMRLAKEGQRGPASMDQRFLDKPAQQAMEQRAETIAQAKAMQANMAKVIEENYEYIQTLKAIAGASSEATEGLREVRPEAFSKLGSGMLDPSQLKGTILDPSMGEAMKLMLPTRGGGEEAIRLPAAGRGLGRRDYFETELGQVGASDITKMFDKLIAQAKQIRVATGQVDFVEDAETYAEAAQITSRAIKAQVAEIYKLGRGTEEGKAAMQDFVNKFMPFIESIEGAANIQFAKIKKSGQRDVETFTGTSAEYVKSRKTDEQKMLAVQDILAERAATKTGVKPGSFYGKQGYVGTESVGRMGAIFDPKNVEALKGAMEKLGIVMEKDADHVNELYNNLEQLKENLVSALSVAGVGRASGRPSSESLRPYAQSLGGGSARAPMAVATEFRTDITAPLAKAKERLEQLRDAGKNVDEALAAVDRIAALQVDVEALPRDAVMLSKKDYENLKRSIMAEQGIGEAEAAGRMERGVSLRYPVTGGQSMQVVKILQDAMGTLTEGKVGVAGPPAGEPGDIAAVIGELEKFRASLAATVEQNRGFGAAADEARREISTIDPVIEGLRQSFISATQNLDFDGDKIAVFGALSEEAAKSLRTFTETAMAGGVSFENIMSSILTKSGGIAGGGMGGIDEYAAAFGKLAKGRTGALKSATLMPDTAETARFEAQAHTGAKTSVGLLTDAFNKLQIAILGGAEQTGDAMATGVERIMLFINKSLAQKHGGGGAAGPMEFVETFARGPQGMKEIFAGMDQMGDDIYGELGKFNKEYRERMYNMLIAQPRETVQQLAREAGALESDGELTPDNFVDTIKNMVNKLDLKGQFKVMWEMLEENMKRALLSEGMGADEVSATMNKMLTQVNKRTGKTQGLDLNRLMQNMFPEYRATRGMGVREIKKMPAMEQAQKVMQMLGIYLGQAAEDAVDELNIDVDPKDVAAQLTAKIHSFMESISNQFEVASTADFARTTNVRGAGLKRIRGQHIPDPKTGGPGRILLSQEKLFDPLVKAIAHLERVASGAAPATSDAFIQIGKALSDFSNTLAHEGVHKAAKEFPDAIDSLVRRITTAGGDLSKHANVIFESLSKLSNVKSSRGKFEKVIQAESQGATEFKGVPIAQARKLAASSFARLSVEELVAHLADPDRWKKMFGHLPEAVQKAAKSAFAEIAGTAPEIIKPVQTWAEEIRSTVAEAMRATFGGEGVGAVREEALRRSDALAAGEPYPGREKFHQMRDVLGAGEKTLAFGRRMHGLASYEKVEGKVGAGKIDIGGEQLVGQIGKNLRQMLETAISGEVFNDPAAAGELERQFKAGARQYYEALKGLGRDQFSGSAWKEYQKAQLEFQAAEATAIINKARDLERQIADMRAQGQQDIPEFRDLLERFGETVQELFRSYEKNIKLGGVGRGTATGLAVTPDQLLSDPALEMGLRPTGAQYQQVMQSYQGREGTEDFKRFAGLVTPMNELLESIERGEDATREWTALWSVLIEKPEAFYENMVRVKEILAKWSRLKGLETDPFSEASLELKRLSDEANNAKKAMDKLGQRPRSEEDIMSLRTSSKQFGQIYERGQRGGLADSLKEQMKAAKTEAKRLARELTDALQSGVELPRHFEPRKIQLVDPKSGQVLQVMELQAKRFGKSVQVSMKQAGRGAQEFGGHMKNALRRVVQWGFATGIIYGTMRAFRSLVDTIVTVETKIANLKKVMDTSVVNFERMQDSAVGFAKEFGVSIDEVLDGMVVYGQQGLKVNEIMERTRATMLAVNVTTLSATEATEALTSAHKVFGDQVSGSIEFVDAWAHVAARHAITAADLADAVKRSGAAAQVAGVGFEDFLGVVTAIGAVTRQSGKEVATSTKFMFRAMRRPTAQKELGKMGISSMTAGGDFRPAIEIMKELAGSWDGLTRAQQVNIAQAMAGIRHYNSFIVLMENFDEALLASADAANSQGFAMRKNRMSMATMAKQMGVLRESVRGVALEIGKAFLPAATSIVNVVGKIIGVVGKLPGPLLQAGTLIGGLGITIHKGLDLALDSLEALAGSQAIEGVKGIGMISGGMAAGTAVKAGVTAGLSGEAGASVDSLQGLANISTKATKGFLSIGSSAIGAIPGLKGFGAAIKGASAATQAFASASVIGLIVTGMVLLYGAYQDATKTGKEFEEEMENIIGRSEDAASALRSQSTQADRLALAYDKFQQALSNLEDPEGLKVALDEGRYKSATVAATRYKDMVADISRNLAQVDPENIQGISESGEYVMSVASNFKQLTKSALDSQNALTAMFKTDVIQAYAKELEQPKSVLDKIAQAVQNTVSKMTGGAVGEADLSVMGKLKDVRAEIEKAAKARKAQADQGLYTGQGRMNDLVKQEVELRGQALDTAQEMVRVFDSMPRFEDMGVAMSAFTPDLYKAMSGAAETGVMGRGVTGGAVATAYMAKQSGLGGIISAKEAVSPAMLAGSMYERGIGASAGAGAISGGKTGEMAIFGEEVARMLVQSSIKGLEGTDASAVVSRAQVAFAEVNQSTGELLYRFWDDAAQTSRTVSAAALEEMVSGIEGEQGRVASAFARWSQEEVEQAAEQSKKILSLQYTGALAGIRQPSGGMPQIGPARFEEVSADQRILKEFPAEMQRLADVQAELNQVTKEYSEDVLDDVESAYKRQGKAGKALKVMTNDILQLATQLQREGFDLTVLAHYSKAQHELNMILEEAATAARDAAAAEELRNKYMIETSGAMAGMTSGVNVDFGKTTRELSSLERGRLELPGFDKFAQNLSSVERQREAQLQTLIEVEKRKSRFEDAVSDLATAGEDLTAEQMGKYLEARTKGATSGEMELLKQLETGNKTSESLMGQQLSVQQGMLEALIGINETTAITAEYSQELSNIKEDTSLTGNQKKQKIDALERDKNRKLLEATRGAIGEAETPALMQALGKTLGPAVNDVFRQVLQIQSGEGGYTAVGRGVAGVTQEQRQGLANLMTALDQAQAQAGGDMEPAMPITWENFNKATQQMEKRTLGPGMGAQTKGESVAYFQNAIQELMGSIFAGPGSEALRGKAVEIMGSGTGQENVAQQKQAESLERAAAIEQLIAQKRNEVFSAYEQAMIQQIAGIEQANKKLAAKETGRLALAANDLANTLDQMVKDFKKADMLYYEKVDSDIEGPMARVGQEGFRTQWENRRRDLDKQYGSSFQTLSGRTIKGAGRPMSLADMQSRRQAEKQIGFDEKEAKIKAEQDIEVNKLRTQQQQAESVMDTLATQLSEGTFAGDPQMESQIRRYMETLKGELATSEQATKRGDELYFRGIPGLEDVQKFAQQMRTEAKSKAKEAEAQLYRASIADPIVNATNQQTQKLASELNNLGQIMQSSSKGGPGGAPGGKPVIDAKTGRVTAQMQAIEKDIANRRAPGTGLTYRPGYETSAKGKFHGLAPKEALEGTGTVDFRQYFEPNAARGNVPAVGLTNQNIQAQLAAKANTGRDDALPGAITATDQGVAGAASDPARRVNERGTGETTTSQSDAISSISDTLQALTEAIAGLSDGGLQIPDTLTSAIGELPSQIGTEISGQTLKVSIEDTPVSVSVDNIGDLGTAATEAVASSLGADISDAQQRLTAVEGLASSGGTLDTRIASVEASISEEASTREAADTALDTRVSAVETLTEQLDPDQFETITTQTTTISTAVEELGTKVTTNEANITTIQTNIDTLTASVSTVEDTIDEFEGRITDAETLVSDATTTVESLQETIETLEQTVATAVTTSETAQSLAEEVRDSLTTFRAEVESQKQNLESQIRSTTTNIDQINTELRNRKLRIDSIERDAKNALTTAQSAMSIAQGRG